MHITTASTYICTILLPAGPLFSHHIIAQALPVAPDQRLVQGRVGDLLAYRELVRVGADELEQVVERDLARLVRVQPVERQSQVLVLQDVLLVQGRRHELREACVAFACHNTTQYRTAGKRMDALGLVILAR